MKRDNASILVVDDDPALLSSLQEILEAEGYEVTAAADGESGLRHLKEQAFDLVLSDLALPGLDGMELLQYLQREAPECPCIIITGYGTIANAVSAMHQGAYDYFTKPVDPTELRLVVARALEHRRLKWENLHLKKQLHRRYGFANMVGTSDGITRVFDLIRKVADTDSNVLILGESGTGKELIAHAIHYNSPRREGPFIPVNCAAIPEELLESELFGHERGAFTHAVRTRIGRFELANGGSIFLDEISEMSPGLQVKILRVLQDHSFERIGGIKTIRVDIRVIAATNRDLEELVRQNRFREDLFYRLNVIPIRVPPLRERVSDIPLLIQHFLQLFSRTKKKPLKRISPAAMDLLRQHPWPGNVREVENLDGTPGHSYRRRGHRSSDDRFSVQNFRFRLSLSSGQIFRQREGDPFRNPCQLPDVSARQLPDAVNHPLDQDFRCRGAGGYADPLLSIKPDGIDFFRSVDQPGVNTECGGDLAQSS